MSNIFSLFSKGFFCKILATMFSTPYPHFNAPVNDAAYKLNNLRLFPREPHVAPA